MIRCHVFASRSTCFLNNLIFFQRRPVFNQDRNPMNPVDIPVQEVVNYCASRLRAAMIKVTNPDSRPRPWLQTSLIQELVGACNTALFVLFLTPMPAVFFVIHRHGRCHWAINRHPIDGSNFGTAAPSADTWESDHVRSRVPPGSRCRD